MKRFVEKDWVAGLLGGTFAWGIAALTGAGVGATYLIALGVLAIVLCFMLARIVSASGAKNTMLRLIPAGAAEAAKQFEAAGCLLLGAVGGGRG